MNISKLLGVAGALIVSASLIVGCSTNEVKEETKKVTPNKVSEEQVETTQESNVALTLNTKPKIKEKWDSLAKDNDLPSFAELESDKDALKNGIKLVSIPTEEDPDKLSYFQSFVYSSTSDKKMKEKVVETTAKSLFPSISDDMIKQWKELYKKAEEVDTSKKELSMPMLKIGDEYEVVFVKMEDDKETKENDGFIMIQVEKVDK